MSDDAADDGDALVRAAKTDREAFGRLYDRYYGPIDRYCRKRSFGADGAEDLVAETFLAAARAMGDFAGTTEIDFRCWLFRIAANAANLAARKRTTEMRHADKLRAGGERGHERGPEAAAMAADEWERVAAAIGKLDERSQTVVTLRYFEQMEHEEIAKTVAARPATVRSILSRALERLRVLLRPARADIAGAPGGTR
ncbi:MAG TPA: sigma-70 family RNA polymerase sigma factor [Planctomycetia bacterium]|nr:sigma-70 family RNA polymerase sigma factor [Planctomycetia bacterium]